MTDTIQARAFSKNTLTTTTAKSTGSPVFPFSTRTDNKQSVESSICRAYTGKIDNAIQHNTIKSGIFFNLLLFFDSAKVEEPSGPVNPHKWLNQPPHIPTDKDFRHPNTSVVHQPSFLPSSTSATRFFWSAFLLFRYSRDRFLSCAHCYSLRWQLFRHKKRSCSGSATP